MLLIWIINSDMFLTNKMQCYFTIYLKKVMHHTFQLSAISLGFQHNKLPFMNRDISSGNSPPWVHTETSLTKIASIIAALFWWMKWVIGNFNKCGLCADMMEPETWLKFFIDYYYYFSFIWKKMNISEQAQLFLIFQLKQSIWDWSVVY